MSRPWTEAELAAIVKRSGARLVERGQKAEPHKVRDGLPMARPKKPKRPYASEATVLRACMEVLEAHPAVALWWRNNTGAMHTDGRFIRFSFKGASDLMAMLVGGRFLAVECKATGKRPSPEQGAFLDNVVDHGGASCCIDDAGRLKEWLDGLTNHVQNAQEGHQEAITGVLEAPKLPTLDQRETYDLMPKTGNT